MHAVTEITEALFNAVAQIQRLDADSAPASEMIHQQVATYIDQGMRTARRLGYSDQDVDDMRYALAALADETVVQKGGELRDFWLQHLLQLRYFNENVAGTAFFERLEKVRDDPGRADVLQVYYQCLLFGFTGKYRVRGGQLDLDDVIERVRHDLVKAGKIREGEGLSPEGERLYEPMADARRNFLLVSLSLVAAAASLLLYVGLKLSLINQATRIVERLTSLSGG